MEATSFSRLKTGFFVVTQGTGHILFCIKVITDVFILWKGSFICRFGAFSAITGFAAIFCFSTGFGSCWIWKEIIQKVKIEFPLEVFTRHDWNLGFFLGTTLTIDWRFNSSDIHIKMVCKMQNAGVLYGRAKSIRYTVSNKIPENYSSRWCGLDKR